MTRHFRYDVPLESLPAAHQRIYQALYTAAYLGVRCPSNKELASVSGRPNASPRYATEAVLAIEAAGLITVHRGRTARIVILASGQSTAGDPTDLKPVTARAPVTAPASVPTAPRFERTSCSYCGVRSDLGCQHSRRAA